MTPQERNAANQRDRVRRAIAQAAVMIRAEIRASYDPESGSYRYGKNGGRVSEAEVLRRAGKIDKNTVKQPYHAKSRKTLRRLVEWAERKCVADDTGLVTNRKLKQEADREEIAYLKQLLATSEVRRDIAEDAANAAKRNEKDAVAKALMAEREVERLTQLLLEARRSV